jgi:hypothetical protein
VATTACWGTAPGITDGPGAKHDSDDGTATGLLVIERRVADVGVLIWKPEKVMGGLSIQDIHKSFGECKPWQE